MRPTIGTDIEIRPQPKNVRHESREETRNNRQSEQQNVHTGENRCERHRTPRNWFEEWFGQRQPARNKKGPNRTPKRKTEIKHQTGSPAEEPGRSSAGDLAIVVKVAPSP